MLTTIAAIAIAFACLCVMGGMSIAAHHDRSDEQRERTARKLAIVRAEQRSPRVVERNLERRREREIQRSRWPQLERTYAEIERAGDA